MGKSSRRRYVICKKYVNISPSSETWQPEKFLFARDKARHNFGYNISDGYYLHINSISRNQKKKIIYLKIEFTTQRNLNSARIGWNAPLVGPLEQFKKHFDIVERTKL
jgi:hypothetical protein